jgi:peptidyl-dipeptidase Dcp
MPEALLEKIKKASKFNQGFATVEYTASALIDIALHRLTNLDGFDPTAFEKQFLEQIEMPAAIKLRHRLPHFLHLFASSGYAAQYYVYLWAGVLDADGFDAFKEAGNPFAEGPARRLKEWVYEAGNTQEPMDAYIAFRGRAPTVEPLLAKRGLLG